MNQMSLVAICKEYRLSRRAIQGYEQIGLVKPSGKTKYGYLLYDENTVYKILFIKHLQNIGFTLREITTFIDESNDVIKRKLEEKIPELESNISKTKDLLSYSKKIIKLLDQEDYKEQIYQITKKENV
ncbi:MAG: MerR family transcriptional regulator [Erysipelotrichaceae bacterium]|nr:MerR family transcriptional regulator [Erysipelotrichaceae bacterium]